MFWNGVVTGVGVAGVIFLLFVTLKSLSTGIKSAKQPRYDISYVKSRIDSIENDLAEAFQSLAEQIRLIQPKLDSDMQENLRKYMNVAIEERARQLTERTKKSVQTQSEKRAELESWIIALTGGRESMQEQARCGLPSALDTHARGRLQSHLERNGIKLGKPKATDDGNDPGGSQLLGTARGDQRSR